MARAFVVTVKGKETAITVTPGFLAIEVATAASRALGEPLGHHWALVDEADHHLGVTSRLAAYPDGARFLFVNNAPPERSLGR